MERLPTGRLVRAGLVAIATLLLVAPTVVIAHAELDTATPADGATLEGSPPEVSGTFTQDMQIDGSSLELRDAGGQVVAKGGVDPNDPRRMAIEDLPVLVPGTYEVRWTTVSAEDDETARDHWTFTVVAAASPSPTVAPEPTATAVATVTAAPTAPAATATAAPSSAPSASVAASAATSGAPTPAPSGDTGAPAASTSDVLLPILAGLAIVVLVAAVLLRRRDRTTPPA